MKRYTCTIDVIILADNSSQAWERLQEVHKQIAENKWASLLDMEDTEEDELND